MTTENIAPRMAAHEEQACRQSIPHIAELAAVQFSDEVLVSIHRWCLSYKSLVRRGGIPTLLEDRRFLLLSRVCYSEVVTHVERT